MTTPQFPTRLLGYCHPPLRILRGVYRVHLEAMVMEPRPEVCVRQEAVSGPDVVHDLPKVGVALRHAQVPVLLTQQRLCGRMVSGGQSSDDARAICSARTRGKLLNGYTVGFERLRTRREAVGFGLEYGVHMCKPSEESQQRGP